MSALAYGWLVSSGLEVLRSKLKLPLNVLERAAGRVVCSQNSPTFMLCGTHHLGQVGRGVPDVVLPEERIAAFDAQRRDLGDAAAKRQPRDAEARVGENARRVRLREKLRQARQPHLSPVVAFQIGLSERLDGLFAMIEPDRHFSDERRAESVEQGIDDTVAVDLVRNRQLRPVGIVQHESPAALVGLVAEIHARIERGVRGDVPVDTEDLVVARVVVRALERVVVLPLRIDGVRHRNRRSAAPAHSDRSDSTE